MIPFQCFRHVNYVDVILLQNVLLGDQDTVIVLDEKTTILHGTEQHGNMLPQGTAVVHVQNTMVLP